MRDNNSFDIEFDFRNDKWCEQKDPDTHSKTLYEYHQRLWNKNLPNGEKFEIKINENYLELLSADEKFCYGSDTMINTYSHWKRQKDIMDRISFSEINEFNRISNTIGNFIIFPRKPNDEKYTYLHHSNTINMKRGAGCIKDRFDLTLECIRRFYLNMENNVLYNNTEDNPLYEVFKTYVFFFEKFKTFEDYCKFFLLDDLVDENYKKINFFIPFENFQVDGLPKSVDEYFEYKKNCINFIKRRNDKMLDFIKKMN